MSNFVSSIELTVHADNLHPYKAYKNNRVRTDSSSDTDRGPVWMDLD